MAATLTFKLDDKAAQKAYADAISALKTFRIPLGITAKYQMKQIQRQYQTEGSHILGGKWHPLAASTIRQRVRQGFGAGPILTRSGKMRASNKVQKLTNNRLEIGNKTVYFKYHEDGKGRMNRQTLGHSEKMMNDTLDIFEKYISKRING